MEAKDCTQATLQLWCAAFGECTVSSVNVKRDARVRELRAAIHEAMRFSERYPITDLQLTLYVAQVNGAWLEENRDFYTLLQEDAEEESKFTEMYASQFLSAYFDEDFDAKPGEIHVIVQLPESIEVRPVKRPRTNPPLWDYADWKHTSVPHPNQLRGLLEKPLPYRLALQNDVNDALLFQHDATLVDCPELTRAMDYFLDICKKPLEEGASENSWQQFYDTLLRIPELMCSQKGLQLQRTRNRVDATGSTKANLRPDFIFAHQGVVLLRGEEKSAQVSRETSLEELTSKMHEWNVVLYGDLKYILGYATSGRKVEIVAIESIKLDRTSLLTLDIITDKEGTLKAFANLAALLYEMVSLTSPPYERKLKPFQKDHNKNRTLEMLDTMVIRTITIKQCRNDRMRLQHLTNVYKDLQQLKSRVGNRMRSLQTVKKVVEKKGRCLVVHLSPLGYARKPVVEEVKQWLQDILTALKYWHEGGYCHGDLRFQNIMFVPGASGAVGGPAGGHWMLIDLDESHKNEKVTISWAHQRKGEDRLRYQHDLFQLGILMEELGLNLPETLKAVQSFLQGALETRSTTATKALALVNKIDAAV